MNQSRHVWIKRMNTEIEAKFLFQDHEVIRQKLQALSALCEQPMRSMRRTLLDYPDRRLQRSNDGFIRVRDEGDRTTLTYKQFNDTTLDGAKEIELTVSSAEDTIRLLETIGLEIYNVSESKRETWRLEEVEIVLDKWPWLEPYIEIEGKSESAIKTVAQKLDLSWDDAVFGSVTQAYRVQYPHLDKKISIGSVERIAFDAPVPDILIEY